MPDITSSSSSGLSDFQLKLSYFLVSNKLLLRKIFIVLMVLLNCLFWGFVIYGLALWGLDYQRLNKQTNDLLFDSNAILPSLEATKPQNLTVSDIQSFGSGSDRYDLMAEVRNTNTNWLATFDYAFIDNASTTVYPGFALPGQRKILLALGKANSTARLQLTNIKWTKITDFPAIANNRERFLVENNVFIPAPKATDPSRVKFTISNQSPYSYWQAGLVVIIYSGSSAVAVNYLTIPQFVSGSTRNVEMNWINPLPSIDNMEIIPEINYLDPNNIMPPAN